MLFSQSHRSCEIRAPWSTAKRKILWRFRQLSRLFQTVKEVAKAETAPFIQIRKSVQALWLTARNRAGLKEQPVSNKIKRQLF